MLEQAKMGTDYSQPYDPDMLKARWSKNPRDKIMVVHRDWRQFVEHDLKPSLIKNGKKQKGMYAVSVSKKEKLSHDLYHYELSFPNKKWISGLAAGSSLNLHVKDNITGEFLSRKYTPVSLVNKNGSLDLLVKVYRPN